MKNVKDMKDGGWIVNVEANPKQIYATNGYCGNETFWGYKYGAAIGYVKATFKGSGTGTLDYGSCYTKGKTRVYLNNHPIAEVDTGGHFSVGGKSEVISFNYKKGDVLKITEEEVGIIKINSLKLEACKEEGNYLLKLKSEQMS